MTPYKVFKPMFPLTASIHVLEEHPKVTIRQDDIACLILEGAVDPIEDFVRKITLYFVKDDKKKMTFQLGENRDATVSRLMNYIQKSDSDYNPSIMSNHRQ